MPGEKKVKKTASKVREKSKIKDLKSKMNMDTMTDGQKRPLYHRCRGSRGKNQNIRGKYQIHQWLRDFCVDLNTTRGVSRTWHVEKKT